MRLYDTNKHLLCLTIRIILRAQGALKVLVSAPYWLVNKTGNVVLVLSAPSHGVSHWNTRHRDSQTAIKSPTL